jgi:hypothetical protein
VTLLVAMLGTAGPASVLLMLVILGRLTKRWEAITRTRSYYRWFYAAGTLVALASLSRLIRIGHLPLIALGQDLTGRAIPAVGRPAGAGLSPFLESSSWFYLIFYHLPLVTAMTISLILAWRNWGWLLRARETW